MPEIKNTFVGGKMNKDLDERLMPNGQYRNALNVEVATAEGAGIGVVKNILGNKRIDVTDTFSGIPIDFTCVGTIANEKTNKLYWFITTYLADAIFEYDVINEEVLPVIIDMNGSNSKAVLRFGATPIITGINIIDNLLFWTDNVTDPKKINIDDCKKGTTIDSDGTWNHTQLKFKTGSFDGVTLENLGPTPAHVQGGNNNPRLDFLKHKPSEGRYFFFNSKQISKALGEEGIIPQGEERYVNQYRGGIFFRKILVKIWTDTDSITSNGTHGRIAVSDPSFIPFGNPYVNTADFKAGDILYGIDVTLDIEERHITVVKPKPVLSPAVKINHKKSIDSPGTIPNIFETKFPRFSYRYKFRDGEFSTFAPFTEAVFNPLYPKDINSSVDSSVFLNKDNVYSTKDPSNKAMANSIHSIELTDFVTLNTPEDVIEIEILYKQENSTVIYSIGSIKHNDSQWHLPGNTQGYELGYNKANGAYKNNFMAQGGYTKGKYLVTTENIYAALPANQILRPWDNVPRRALAQEVTGNRIVYGNYLQNYDFNNYKTAIKVSYSDRKNNIGSFETQGLPSLKSQRNYQLGVVYCDEHGRETPVFTSNDAALSIPWAEYGGEKNASRSLQLNANIVAGFPQWVESMKFFVKETSNEYYNLIMERAWIVQKTYEIDNSEGHLWISFPSSDRNKVSEGEYIVLKKKVGTGEEQVANENRFKIIDISNEAPDSIRYELVNQGITSSADETNLLFGGVGSNGERPDNAGTNNLFINIEEWMTGSYKGVPLQDGDDAIETRLRIKNLYVSWFKIKSDSTTSSSAKYKVLSGRLNSNGDHIMLKLANNITSIDADIAHVNGDSSGGFDETTNMHADIRFQIEQKEEKTGEDFSGLFFVKISKNEVTDIIESGSVTNVLDNNQVSANTPIFWWRDSIAGDVGSAANTTNRLKISHNSHGLTNYNGTGGIENDGTTPMNSDNTIHHVNNNEVGSTSGTSQTTSAPYLSGNMRLTDFAKAWEGIQNVYCGGQDKGRFFLDSMYMVAGQSEASNYAKYCCVTWSGAISSLNVAANLNTGDSSWKYPPLKIWLGDYEDSASIIENLETDTPTLFDNMLLSTSILKDENEDWGSQRVDGWIGHSQHVDRLQLAGISEGHAGLSHVNGLEGIVTSNPDHSRDARRWFSGITGSKTEFGAGVDTKTYAEDEDQVGRHFIHLSYFAPGKDLHSGGFGSSDLSLFGENAVGNRLQGIWGGGHFTGKYALDEFGTSTDKHSHICLEGNYDEDGNYLDEAPGPGVGFGYDMDYKTLHERQWDPTFPSDPGNKTRDFLRNLHAGSKFRFKVNKDGSMTASDDLQAKNTIYTIKNVSIKKLYNHTSWRNTFNRWESSLERYFPADDSFYYWSVEKAGINWLANLNSGGGGSGSDYTEAHAILLDKITDFGKSHNRRVCYIIEVDKDPTATGNFNPIEKTMAQGRMTADFDSNEFHTIEFLEKTKSIAGVNDLNKFPAIWETSPDKQEVDLDIYFEASSNIPVKLNSRTNEIFAPLGCFVEALNAPVSGTSNLVEWNGLEATFQPGFPLSDGTDEIDYTDISFKFVKGDGSFVVAKADTNILTGNSTDPDARKTKVVFREDIGENIRVGLAWNNCFSFGNGLESNRILDDFNQMFILNGVKASTTTQQTYEEERRLTGLIYSGLYNSNSGVNDLNQFIMAEKITKDLNPTFGSIQKLFQRRISLVAFCEDRVVSITSNKDAIFNADGNPQLIASNKVLGDANPFEGNYGISKNPESFASESYRAYFTDKNRGAVIRLSKDGLTPISSNGMHDWFRDNLPAFNSLIGSYDAYKQDYNISITNTFGENLLLNSYVESGVETGSVSGGFVNSVDNPGVFNGDSMQYAYQEFDVSSDTQFEWGSDNENLITTTTIKNHAKINEGDVFSGVPYDPIVYNTGVVGDEIDINNLVAGTFVSYLYSQDGSTVATQTVVVIPGTATGPNAGYVTGAFGDLTTLSDSTQSIYNGQFKNPNQISSLTAFALDSQTGDSTNNSDPNRYSKPVRHMHYYSLGGLMAGMSYGFSDGYADETQISNTLTYNNGLTDTGFGSTPSSTTAGYGFITTEQSTGNILFNKVATPGDTGFIEFRDLGVDPSVSSPYLGLSSPNYDGLNAFNQALDDQVPSGTTKQPNTIFNGEEIEVTVEYEVEPTNGTIIGTSQPFNQIRLSIELRDGPGEGAGHHINSNKFTAWNASYTNTTVFNANGGLAPDFSVHDQVALTTDRFFSFGNGYSPSNDENLWDTSNSFGSSANGYPQTVWKSNSSNSFNYESYTGNTSDWYAIKQFHSSSKYTFPQTITETIPASYLNIQNAVYLHSTTSPETYTASVKFKFQDPNQNAPNYDFIDAEINSVAVVEDLVVRVKNEEDPWSNSTDTNWPAASWQQTINNNLGGQLGMPFSNIFPSFKILSVKVNKIVAALAPSIAGSPTTTAASVSSTNITNYVANTDYTGGVNGVDPIPTAAEANSYFNWTEVKNGGINGWVSDNVVGGSNESFSQQLNATGNTFLGVPKTRSALNGYGSPAVGSPFTWLEPPANLLADPSLSIHGNNGYVGNGVPGAILSTQGNYGPTTANTGLVINDFPSAYYRVKTSSLSTRFDFTYVMSGSYAFQANNWYLVDIEFDGSNYQYGDYDTGSGGNSGRVFVEGVLDNAWTSQSGGAISGDEVHPDGVGLHAGDSGNTSDIQMVQVSRFEYGNPETVLRALFQFSPNSTRAISGDTSKLVLKFKGFVDGARITKIISRKLPVLASGGSADRWESGTDFLNHSFSRRTKYYENLLTTGSALCWDNHAQPNSLVESRWSQVFAVGKTPVTSSAYWRLKFKVTGNPNVNQNVMIGTMGVQVFNRIGDYIPNASEYSGLFIAGITEVGVYEFTFNMDGDTLAVNADGDAIWTATKDGVNYAPGIGGSTLSEFTSPQNYGSSTNSDYENRISFFGGNNGLAAITCAVSEILLTDETLVLTGGTVNSWEWNGFDDSLENYIQWDEDAGRIQYNNSPTTDPDVPVAGATQISVSQYVDIPIKKFSKWKVSIMHDLDVGTLEIYYFNANGFGFRIANISGVGITDADVVVGDEIWGSVNPYNTGYAPELKNTFVIVKAETSLPILGWVDNITMVKQYDLNQDQDPITISFSEKVNGWTSFKSFVPEQGLSVSKKYFTLLNGALWQHYVGQITSPYQDAYDTNPGEEATNYNTFYNNFTASSITTVLNNEPSIVKVFNTLNYEGSQSLVRVPKDVAGVIPAVSQVNINNVLAWNNIDSITGLRDDIKGWACTKIQTDLEAGSVHDFINKEGKWFGYIKGFVDARGTNYLDLDKKLFSVQGIGVASGVTLL